jgi:hypothetical protein
MLKAQKGGEGKQQIRMFLGETSKKDTKSNMNIL